MSCLGWFRKAVFGIPPEEAAFARRGFRPVDRPVQDRLERAGRTFICGYGQALAVTHPGRLGDLLNRVDREFRGFAFEGAAMGLALLDFLTPWKATRWSAFLAGPGNEHAYMLHVGAGWAAARIPWARRRIERHLRGLDPLLRWLVLDGYGFHEGFFHWPQAIRGQAVPKPLSGYGGRAFDQGLGRSLWFVEGADVERIAATIGGFAAPRQADLWSGVGLACAYAGEVDLAAIEVLRSAAGGHRAALAQGAAFAAKARQRAANPASHTELACQTLCGMSADAAAAVTDEALEALPPDGPAPAYECWRERIQQRMPADEVASETNRPRHTQHERTRS